MVRLSVVFYFLLFFFSSLCFCQEYVKGNLFSSISFYGRVSHDYGVAYLTIFLLLYIFYVYLAAFALYDRVTKIQQTSRYKDNCLGIFRCTTILNASCRQKYSVM